MMGSQVIGFLFILFVLPEILSQQQGVQVCTTPNGNYGFCTPVRNCLPITNFIMARQQTGFTRLERQYISRIQCFGVQGTPPFACCALGDSFFSAPVSESVTQRPIGVRPESSTGGTGNILPNPDNFECGFDKMSFRIFGGTETELGEFPWMALLEYRTSRGARSFNCGGSLINTRYVLTVAHCLVGDVIQFKGKLVTVRLGEHNIETDEDCETAGGTRICSEPVLNVGVDSTVVHPDYRPNDANRYYDIGLVRLAREVTYSEFVKPVCLPPAAYKSNDGATLIVAGWGKTEQGTESDTKQKVELPAVNLITCHRKYMSLKEPITLGVDQMCAGGVLGQDTCAGDSGGPLISMKNNQWFAEGLVSFGVSCGLKGWPGVYTRVTSYRDWIMSNISP